MIEESFSLFFLTLTHLLSHLPYQLALSSTISSFSSTRTLLPHSPHCQHHLLVCVSLVCLTVYVCPSHLGELNRAMLLDLPTPDLLAYHDYLVRLQQQEQEEQRERGQRERGLGLGLTQPLYKDKDKGSDKEEEGKEGARRWWWWWWGGGRSKKGVRPELNIFWHNNGHRYVQSPLLTHCLYTILCCSTHL